MNEWMVKKTENNIIKLRFSHKSQSKFSIFFLLISSNNFLNKVPTERNSLPETYEICKNLSVFMDTHRVYSLREQRKNT